MQREEIEEIVRQVISKMNNSEIYEKETPIDNYDNVLSDIDFRIEMVRRYHSTLRSAVAAVIPNEDPHAAVLEEVNRWIDIARAAQIGQLRNERNSVVPYTPDELDTILTDGDILDLPSDGISLSNQSIYSQDPEYFGELSRQENNEQPKDAQGSSIWPPILGSVYISTAVYALLRALEHFFGK